MTGESGARQVVIVGGGFAGLFAARAVSRAPVQVTLLDRAEHHVFQPLLYQCATGILSEGKIAMPLRELLRKHDNVEFVIAEVTGINPAERRVRASRPLGEPIEFGYDYLILAAGVRQSYFGHDEYAAFAPGMKTIEDAMKIRRRVFGAFELAESADDPEERARWLTFALVGAGPTGVELAGQISGPPPRIAGWPGCRWTPLMTTPAPCWPRWRPPTAAPAWAAITWSGTCAARACRCWAGPRRGSRRSSAPAPSHSSS
jgi:NADH:ubiquinone reductase (H+-translocating)